MPTSRKDYKSSMLKNRDNIINVRYKSISKNPTKKYEKSVSKVLKKYGGNNPLW